MSSHQHGPNCGCSDEAKELANVQSLLPVVDTQHITCYNEAQPSLGRIPFKPYTDRLQTIDKYVYANDNESDLLYIIPFIVTVKLRSLRFIHNNNNLSIKLYINRDDIDMSNVNDIQPLQQLQINADNEGVQDYNVKVTKFNAVNTLIMYVKASNDEAINISYIGLYGDKTNDKRGIVHAVYEARAIPEDHSVSDEKLAGYNTSTTAREGGSVT